MPNKQVNEINDSRFCTATFTSLFIAGNGNVYPCCGYNSKGVSLGNLFTDEVDEILLGIKAQKNRQASLNGCLECNRCNYSTKSYNPQGLSLENFKSDFDPSMVSKIQFELGYKCNSRCCFCNQPHQSNKSLPIEKIKELIIRCSPEDIQLQGGEYYYNKGAKELLEWLTTNKKNAKVFMHTNCVLPEKVAESFMKCVDIFSLNLYGASPSTFSAVTGLNFDIAIKFIKKLVELRESRDEFKDKEFMFKMTTCPTTFHEIPDFCYLGKELKVDSVRFALDYHIGPFLKRYNNEFLARIWHRLNQAIDTLNDVQIIYNSLKPYGFKRNSEEDSKLAMLERFKEVNLSREEFYYDNHIHKSAESIWPNRGFDKKKKEKQAPSLASC